MNEDDFDRVIAINLKGVWLTTKHEIEAMLADDCGGATLNTSLWLAKARSPDRPPTRRAKVRS
jgi:NAD(P)-dependent dehydrogenase (short-subunit alcohol dehydrogenase family)